MANRPLVPVSVDQSWMSNPDGGGGDVTHESIDGNNIEEPDFALKWLARAEQEGARGRSRSRSPPLHVPVLPIGRPHRHRPDIFEGTVAAFPFGLMNAPEVPFGVSSPLGSLCYRALVGRDRGRSALGPNVFMMDHGEGNFSGAKHHANVIIRNIIARRRMFYVGITRDPATRWQRHLARWRAWSRMNVVAEAPDSSLTSALEQALLSEWYRHELCWNNSTGGENPTPSSPHYLYIIEGEGFPRI